MPSYQQVLLFIHVLLHSSDYEKAPVIFATDNIIHTRIKYADLYRFTEGTVLHFSS